MDKSRGLKPTRKAWLIYFQVKLQHTTLTMGFELEMQQVRYLLVIWALEIK